MHAAFAGQDMRGLMREDLIAGPAMGENARDIAHGARWQEHRGFLAEQFGDAFAEQVDGRIVADLFVADLGARDRLAHRRRRPRLRVRQHVDADGGKIFVGRKRGVDHDQPRAVISGFACPGMTTLP